MADRPTPHVLHSHCVESLIPDPGFPPYDGNPEINHPDLGWGSVVMINDHEFRVRFGDKLFAWFKLDNLAVSQWPVQRAAEFARWVKRAA